MFNQKKVADSVSGVAEVTQIASSGRGDKLQVMCNKITTGTGTVTITVKAGSSTEYTSIVDGTIDLTAPIALVIEGKVNAVKGTSSSGSDVYELEVTS